MRVSAEAKASALRRIEKQLGHRAVSNDESEGLPAGRVGTPALPVVRVLGAVTSSSACSPASVPHDRNTVAKGLVEPVVVGELASFYNNAGHCSTRISGGIGRLDRLRGSHLSALDFLVRRRETAACTVAGRGGQVSAVSSDGEK